jgi:hypothetical protein
MINGLETPDTCKIWVPVNVITSYYYIKYNQHKYIFLSK